MAVVIRLGALGLKFGISWQRMGAADGGGNWQASNQINNPTGSRIDNRSLLVAAEVRKVRDITLYTFVTSARRCFLKSLISTQVVNFEPTPSVMHP